MATRSADEQRHWTDIDGIPCVWMDAPGPLQACLVFGVGRADESLPTSGVTHAVEHLALNKRIAASGKWGGTVDLTSTRFFVEGEPDEVVDFFGDVSRGILEPDLARLPDELRVLQVEAGRRSDVPQFVADLFVRFGAQGPGLAALPEYGLHRLQADDVADWASTRFVSGNAAFWMTGPPPRQLRMELLDRPAPTSARLEPLSTAGPAWARAGGTKLVSATVLAPSPECARAVVVAFHAAGARLHRVLRNERALAYEVSPVVESLPDGFDLIGVFCDYAAAHETEVRDVVVETVMAIAADGVTASERDEMSAGRRRALADPRTIPSQLDVLAWRRCCGREITPPEAIMAEVDALDPDDVARALRDALPTMLAIGPPTIEHPPDGFTERLSWSESEVEGHRYAPVPGRERGELVVGDEGISWVLQPERAMTVLFAECGLVKRWDNGDRELFGRDGRSVLVDPLAWWDADGLEALIDRNVPPDLRVDLGPGIETPQRPENEEAMSGQGRAFLESCRTTIGEPPRRFGLRDRKGYLSQSPPIWINPSEPLWRYFDDRNRILRDGRLVWGAIVQANDRLFSPGLHDAPGDVVYSLDRERADDTAALAQLAHRIFALKGTMPEDEERAKLAHHLTDEMERVFGLPVPAGLGNGVAHELSVVMVHRKHLPSGCLKRMILPVLVVSDPRRVMILPAKYWPTGLVKWWDAGEA